MRRGAAIGVRWSDVDVEAGRLAGVSVDSIREATGT